MASSTGWAACIATSGAFSINSNSTDCYDWTSGDIVIATGVSVIPSSVNSSPFSTSGPVATFTNNGEITSNNAAGGGEPIRILHDVTAITNAQTGVIRNSTSAFTVFVLDGTVTDLNNSGQISNSAYITVGVAYGSGVITNLNNSATGSITSGNAPAVYAANGGQISNINNAGTISSASVAIYSASPINSITNTGSIFSSIGSLGIFSPAGMSTLNNSQGLGNAHGALSYSGTLPSNYNIIINGTGNYGQLDVSGGNGLLSFGIHALTGTHIGASGTTYSNVITGIDSSNISNENTPLTYSNSGKSATYELRQGSTSTVWDLYILASDFLTLNLGPSAADTQAALQNSARKLRSVFNLAAISSNFANMNTYDCGLFDSKGVCVSLGGRYTTTDSPNLSSSSAVMVLGYKATPTLRIGGFVDQNLNNHAPAGIDISNKNPLMGLFAVWNQQPDALGYQLKLANAYQEKDISLTREVIGSSEAGRGDTTLNTQSYVGELSYAFKYGDNSTVRPYLALRHTTIKQDAYTESGVSTPLSYANLKDRTTSALLGLKLHYRLTPTTSLTGSLGIEQDLQHSVDHYSAYSAGISGLTSENFNDSIKRTRPVATLGAYYAVSKTQRIAAEVYYQQLAFQSTGASTAYMNYMIGF